MSMPDIPFSLPPLRRGDRVIVARDPAFTHPVLGFVVEPKRRYADIQILVTGGTRLFRDCLYKDDPYIEQRPHLLEDADRGIFVLAESEVELRTVMAELGSQKAMLDQLAAQVGESQKRGRPRKVEDVSNEPSSEESS